MEEGILKMVLNKDLYERWKNDDDLQLSYTTEKGYHLNNISKRFPQLDIGPISRYEKEKNYTKNTLKGQVTNASENTGSRNKEKHTNIALGKNCTTITKQPSYTNEIGFHLSKISKRFPQLDIWPSSKDKMEKCYTKSILKSKINVASTNTKLEKKEKHTKIALRKKCRKIRNKSIISPEQQVQFQNSNEKIVRATRNIQRSIQTKLNAKTVDCNKNKLRLHNDSPLEKKCNICEFSTVKTENLNRHIRRVHDGIKPNQCDYCPYSVFTKKDLHLHIKVMHDQIRNYKCELCSYSAGQKHSLIYHVIHYHKENAHYANISFVCKYCQFSASSQYFLRRHKQQFHHRNKGYATSQFRNYKCNQCDYSSVKKYDVNKHRMFVHPNIQNSKCNFCKYMGISKSKKNVHIMAKHDQIRNYKCNLCLYCTTRKSMLIGHIQNAH